MSTSMLVLTSVFVASLLGSNVLSAKLVSLGWIVIDAGIILFPVTMICADIITEIFGRKAFRVVMWSGLACLVGVAVAYRVGIALPPAEGWGEQEAYSTILGASGRVILASVCAYIIGNVVNSEILLWMKRRAHGGFIRRAIVSTIGGQLGDSLIFSTIAFLGMVPLEDVLMVAGINWILKALYEVAMVRGTAWIVAKLSAEQQGLRGLVGQSA